MTRHARPRVSATGEVVKGMGWALGMPVIILGGIYSGFFTATEAAAIGAFYAVFVEAVIFRALTWRKFVETAQRSAILTSIIFILLAVANVVSFFITLANVSDLVLSFMNSIIAGPTRSSCWSISSFSSRDVSWIPAPRS